MAWTKTPNVAQYKGADWSNFVQKEPSCTPERAKRIALQNPQITFFFFCRERMVLEGPVFEKYGAFNPGDAVFFSGKPWYGSAPQCDSYQKGGTSVVYISPKTPKQLRDVGGYTMADGSPAIDVVCLFAGNYAAAERPYLRAQNDTPPTTKPFNVNIQAALDDGAVQYLQSKGLTVLLSILNGHHPVGWSEFTSQVAAADFVDYLRTDVVDKYGLDGIDIDDEYSSGEPQDTSLAMVTTLMRKAMPGKLITKALWADLSNFDKTWNGHTLGRNLSYGWEMSYGMSPLYRLPPYLPFLQSDQLSLGFWTGQPSASPEQDVRWLKSNGYGGIMVLGFEEQSNVDLMGALVNTWYGPGNWNPPKR